MTESIFDRLKKMQRTLPSLSVRKGFKWIGFFVLNVVKCVSLIL